MPKVTDDKGQEILNGMELTGEEVRVLMLALFHADEGDSLSDDDANAAVELHDKLADVFSRINGDVPAIIAPLSEG